MQDNSIPFQLADAPIHFSTFPTQKENKKITRRKFTPEEDEILKNLVATFGPTDWGTISSHLVGRSARQCRERWKHYISPDVVTGNWTEDENQMLLQKYQEHGSQWAVIAKSFPGRTDIGVKNHYISLSARKSREITIQQQNLPQHQDLNQLQQQLQDQAAEHGPQEATTNIISNLDELAGSIVANEQQQVHNVTQSNLPQNEVNQHDANNVNQSNIDNHSNIEGTNDVSVGVNDMQHLQQIQQIQEQMKNLPPEELHQLPQVLIDTISKQPEQLQEVMQQLASQGFPDFSQAGLGDQGQQSEQTSGSDLNAN